MQAPLLWIGEFEVFGFYTKRRWSFHFEPSWSSLLPSWHEGDGSRGAHPDEIPGSQYSGEAGACLGLGVCSSEQELAKEHRATLAHMAF